jgi:DNA-binding transcriptional LysR family regulator
LARKRNVTIEELYDEHWAISKHPHFAEFIDKFMSRNVSASPGSVETNSLSVLKHLVMTGHFVSIMATHWIEAELKSGAIVPLSLPGTPLTRPAGIILRDTMHQRPPVRKMIEVVREVLGVHKEAQTPKGGMKRK